MADSYDRDVVSLPASQVRARELPDELLDNIIKHLGPRTCERERLPAHTTTKVKGSWVQCALVSHRWNRITRPHLFRWILVAEPTSFDCTPEEARRRAEVAVTALFDFFSSTPSIASLVQEITFCLLDTGIKTFASALDLLPQLRCLQVFLCWQTDEDDHDTVNRQHKLEKLTYNSLGRHSPTDYMPRLFALFSEIGELEIMNCNDIPEDQIPDLAATGDAKELRISRLNFQDRKSIIPNMLLLRRQFDLLSNVSSLYVRIFFTGVSGVKGLGELLSTICPTLTEFRLEYTYFPTMMFHSTGPDLDEGEVMGGLRGALSTCTLLHDVRLVWLANKGAEADWPTAMELVCSVPVDHLKHFSFIYLYSEPGGDAANYDPRTWDWSSFRAHCRRFRNVQNLEVLLEGTREEVKVPEVDCIRDELREFAGALSTKERKCKESGCRWQSLVHDGGADSSHFMETIEYY